MINYLIKFVTFLTLSIALLSTQNAFATTYYYDSSAPNDSGNALTPATARKNLSSLAGTWNTCQAGDVFRILSGSFYSNSSVSLNCQGTPAPTASNPVTLEEFLNPNQSQCVGSGAISSATASTATIPGTYTTDQFAGCDIKVTSRDPASGGYWTQRMPILNSSTVGLLTFDKRRSVDGGTNVWSSMRPDGGGYPSSGDAYVIVGRMPVIQGHAGNIVFFDGSSTTHNGITMRGIAVSGGAFYRRVTSATTGTNDVITDTGLANTLYGSSGSLAGRSINLPSIGNTINTCAGVGGTHTILSNTATTITISGSFGCTMDTTTMYQIIGADVGLYFYAKNSDVVIDGVEVMGATGDGFIGQDPSNHVASNHTIVNSVFEGSGGGLYFTIQNSNWQGNLLNRNGLTNQDHNMYISDVSPQIYFRNNYSKDSSVDIPGSCDAAAIVVHDSGNGKFFTNNLVAESVWPIAGSGRCWGISPASGAHGGLEFWQNLNIRANSIVNYYTGVGLDLCKNCIVENNNIYQKMGNCVSMRAKDFEVYTNGDSGNQRPQNDIVRNNTCNLYGTPDFTSEAYKWSQNSADGPSPGGHKFYSNIAIMSAGNTSSNATCWFMGSNNGVNAFTVSNFAGWDYNQCYSAGSTLWMNNFTTLSAAQTAGIDTHSILSNPTITVGPPPGYKMTITTSSTAYNSASPTNSSPTALGGLVRSGTGAPSKGAYEPNATVVIPGSPTNVH